MGSFQREAGLNVTDIANVATQFLLTVKSPYASITETTKSVIISSNNYAIILWNDGTIYIGLIYTNNQMREGTYIYQDNIYYAGEFQNNIRSGKGIAHYANGDIYDGQWDNDMMNGQGIYYFGGANATEKYSGHWGNNTMDGAGTYTLSNGSQVTGSWKNNKHISW